MVHKYLLWDQDNFVLKGYYENPMEIMVNPTVRNVLLDLKKKGYVNVTLSNKSALITQEKARIVGLEDLFDDFFDARELPFCKTTGPVKSKYGLTNQDIMDHAIYFGDEISNDLLFDVPSAVQVFDPFASIHDFRIFSKIIELLEGNSQNSFKRGYELFGDDYRVMDGFTLVPQQFDLAKVLATRTNAEVYQHVKGISYILTVEDVAENMVIDLVKP